MFSNFLECEDLFGGGWGVTLNSNIKMWDLLLGAFFDAPHGGKVSKYGGSSTRRTPRRTLVPEIVKSRGLHSHVISFERCSLRNSVHTISPGGYCLDRMQSSFYKSVWKPMPQVEVEVSVRRYRIMGQLNNNTFNGNFDLSYVLMLFCFNFSRNIKLIRWKSLKVQVSIPRCGPHFEQRTSHYLFKILLGSLDAQRSIKYQTLLKSSTVLYLRTETRSRGRVDPRRIHRSAEAQVPDLLFLPSWQRESHDSKISSFQYHMVDELRCVRPEVNITATRSP